VSAGTPAEPEERSDLFSVAIFFLQGKIAALFHFVRCAADVPEYRDPRAGCPCH